MYSALLRYLLISISCTVLLTGCGGSSGDSSSTSTKSSLIHTTETGVEQGTGKISGFTAGVQENIGGAPLMAIYMVGSDLESDSDFATSDLKEMIQGYNALAANGTTLPQIIIAFGGAKKTGWLGMKFMNMTQAINDVKDGTFGNENVSDYLHVEPEADMGEEASLKLFLQFIDAHYTNAGNKIITMWNHGAGIYGFGYDENNNNNNLSIAELKTAFEEANLSFTFDIVSFDACLMANYETAKALASHGTYLLGSEETEPGAGWDWNATVTGFAQAATPLSFCQTFIPDYFSYYANMDGSFSMLTMSASKLGSIGNVTSAIDSAAAILETLVNGTDAEKKLVFNATVSADLYSSFSMVDVGDFAKTISNNTSNATVQTAMSNLRAAISDAVVLSQANFQHNDATGLTVTNPTNRNVPAGLGQSATWTSFADRAKSILSEDKTAPTVTQTNSSLVVDVTDPLLWETGALVGGNYSLQSGYFVALNSLDGTNTSGDTWNIPLWDGKTLHLSVDAVADPIVLATGTNTEDLSNATGQFTGYSCLLGLIIDGKSYEDYVTQWDFMKLYYAVNATGDVVDADYEVFTYQYTDDGQYIIQVPLKQVDPGVGDKICSLGTMYNLETARPISRVQVSDWITITKNPEFVLKTFTGNDYIGAPAYAVYARDYARNLGLLDPVTIP